MASAPDFPSVPGVTGAEWELAAESVETVFQLPAMRVVGATRRYEDERTRTAVRDATGGDLDHRWRFVAATRLGFDPGLPPGTLPSMILPMVRSRARQTFEDRLKRRGIADIERGRRERMRVRSGNRARLTRYDGTDPIADGVPVTGWVGVWNDGADFFVVTGGYPGRPLGEALGVESDTAALTRTGDEARSELLDLFRGVS